MAWGNGQLWSAALPAANSSIFLIPAHQLLPSVPTPSSIHPGPPHAPPARFPMQLRKVRADYADQGRQFHTLYHEKYAPLKQEAAQLRAQVEGLRRQAAAAELKVPFHFFVLDVVICRIVCV
jgi:hypothetical protein